MKSLEQHSKGENIQTLKSEFSLTKQELQDFRRLPKAEQNKLKQERLTKLLELQTKLDQAMQDAINTGNLEEAQQLKESVEKEVEDLEQQVKASEVLPTTEKERADAKRIAEIYDKCFRVDKDTGGKTPLNPDLSEEELRFIYEIDFKITGVVNRKDSPLNQILNTRKDKRQDLAMICDCKPEQISLTDEELKNNSIVLHYGDLNFYKAQSIEELKLPANISGDLNLSGLQSADGLILPETISGSLLLRSLKSAEGLKLPRTVGRHLILYGLITATGLILPDIIGGNLYLGSLKTSDDLVLPDMIGGSLNLDSLPLSEKEKLIERYPQYREKIK